MKTQILNILIHIANESYDGHFTVMKFTTNWRVGFGTPDVMIGHPQGHEKLKEYFSEGDTFEKAALKAIEHEVCKSKF